MSGASIHAIVALAESRAALSEKLESAQSEAETRPSKRGRRKTGIGKEGMKMTEQ